MHKALRLVAKHANGVTKNPEGLSNLRDRIRKEWIEMALDKHGRASLRTRKLPAFQLIWLVIGMALFRNRCIAEVVSKLDLVLGSKKSAARSSIIEGKAKLGEEPLETLFSLSAEAWSEQSEQRYQWHDLRLLGIDGTKLNVADSVENRETFGKHGGSRGDSAYPLVRVVCLMALISHIIREVRMGGYEKVSEAALAYQLIPSIPNDSLTILDRNFLRATVLVPISRDGENRQWLTRSKSNTRWTTIEKIGKGDLLVDLNTSRDSLKADPTLPKKYRARAISYQRNGFRPQYLLTSLLDSKKYPAKEIVEMYHVRWELELGYDEIKTEMLDREETIRSKKPGNVRQEIWGIMIAFNLIRKEMEEAAVKIGVLPIRISFIASLHLIVDEFDWLTFTSPGAIPRRLCDLRDKIGTMMLPERRAERSYPREVKIKVSPYPKKRVISK